jgi:hypothetical protein
MLAIAAKTTRRLKNKELNRRTKRCDAQDWPARCSLQMPQAKLVRTDYAEPAALSDTAPVTYYAGTIPDGYVNQPA